MTKSLSELGLPDDWANRPPLERFRMTNHLKASVVARLYGLDDTFMVLANRWEPPADRTRCEAESWDGLPCRQMAAVEHDSLCYKHMDPAEWQAIKELRKARKEVRPLLKVELPPPVFIPGHSPVERVAFTLREAAEITGLTYSQIYFACHGGGLTAHWMGTRLIRILREDLEQFIEDEKIRDRTRREELAQRQKANARRVDELLKAHYGLQ